MDSKVISATRSEQQLTDTAAAAYVISQDDIRRSGATNIPEALRMVPGLQVARVSATKWAISARGFNGTIADKLLVLMDGRSLYSPIHKGVYWDIQDRVLDDVERIEVIRGPGASVWGANAVNGVINIITKHGSDTQDGSLTVFGGDKYGTGLRKGWQFADQGYARVYGKFLFDESFANRLGNDANEEWMSGRGGFRMDWANTDGKHALMLQGDIYKSNYDENFNKNQSFPANKALLDTFTLNRVKQSGGNILGRWNYNPSLASKMTAQFFYDRFEEHQNLNRSLKSEVVDFDFQHVLALNEAHELTWGFNYRLSMVGIKPFGDFPLKEYFPKTFQNHRFSVFLQDKWRFNDDWEMTFGSKFEHHNNNDFEYEPSLRILWKAADQHRVWAGVSRAVRLPAVTDLSADILTISNTDKTVQEIKFRQNQNLVSDAVISYEVGYRYWYTDRFSVDLAAYYNQYDINRTSINDFNDLFPEQSIKKSTTAGLEGTMAWRPFDWTRFQFSASLMNMDITAKRKIKDFSLERNSQDPQFQWSFRSSFDVMSDVEADLWLRYTDAAYGVLNAQVIPSYYAVDVRLAWKPHNNVELSFIANNLNDSKHPEFYDGLTPNPLQAERMFWLQGKLKF